MNSIISNTKKIKQKALELGFADVGISRAGFVEKESLLLREWLDNGCHGEMAYMENHFEKRTDPRELVEGAQSVISVLYNYFNINQQPKDTYKISKYAYGRDYHHVIKEKLNHFFEFIQTLEPKTTGRIFVDSAPVLEKAWAARSGIGWIGKNTNLISGKHGSFLFIGEIILDLELEYDVAIKDFCGACTKCIDACPTKALKPHKLDARKCVSYLTIEKKGEIPEEFKNQWEDWIFGCDICQDVCPWNSKAKVHNEKDFLPKPEIQNFLKSDWENLSPGEFKQIFKDSPLERAKAEGIKRNIQVLKQKY
ncbi:MAG: tRNA epoxyqueuosine(34) reductase QueG [Bacteroidetes bacterium GWC2_33_15]|nr:MAG: tRNA epoxyqueuosine(34) reductase QueG [Bacteroidetes bacterium GWA2_33_15]OFX49373.1 MAG: tRNA epoxyqueuosine(34) reductase QueG [Bacteroidetes bacterium GWC2_33_15]OFX63034.1 MAG: tRNA epoxyqueuosine(34) reductase QueG [Bacteroidetes bacterium GWB2_32_14]OFX68721.1 MAG: tRNA epoxyqueuosine(34) reductase QueG [Bacteroidetes bacterium GWD2_33_33]HAN19109.1 tRNA epoxyqueuosine(34) reductase QueG [Bacteroidales bacterium]